MPSSYNITGFPEEIWSKFSPESFEQFCLDVLRAQNPDADFRVTRASHDAGVDIFLKGWNGAISFFGANTVGPATVFVEVKRRHSVDVHDFARSLVVAAAKRECATFVLLTSAPINVNTYIEFSEFCGAHRLSFSYVYRDLIARTLIENSGIAERWGFPALIPDWPEVVARHRPAVVCHWNFLRISDHGGHSEIDPVFPASERRTIPFGPKEKLKIPLVIGNSGNELCELLVEVVGLDHWRALSLTSKLEAVPARTTIDRLLVFELAAREAVRLPDVHVEAIQASSETASFRVTISANQLHAVPFFEARFVGKAALSQRSILQAFAADQPAAPRPDERMSEWLLIEGPAGVGKSRLVEEALLKPLTGSSGNSALDVRRHFVQRGEDRKVISDVLRDVSRLATLAGRDTVDRAVDLLTRKELTDAAIEAAAEVFAFPTARPLLIIIEDLHHGGDKFYHWLQAVFKRTASRAPGGSAFRFCLTGRNDDTFPNPRQLAFVEAAKRHLRERNLEERRLLQVQPLDGEDTRTLVHSIFHGITVAACDRIVTLSEHIPFNILQVIEYLSEESLVEISERRTYSIRDPNLFYSKLGLPASMAELFSLRLRNLARRPGGTKLVQVLRSLSLLGLQTTRHVFERLAHAALPKGDPWTLFHSNYLVLEAGDRVRFSHENILNFLQAQPPSSKEWKTAAAAIAQHSDILEGIEDWRRCRVLHAAGRDTEAAAIVTRVVGDGSVAGLGRNGALADTYQVLRIGVDLWSHELASRDAALFLLNLYFLWAYASKFTRHYGETIRDALDALNALQTHPGLEVLVGTRAFDLACAKIEQIVGHAFQNAGDLDRSMEHIQRAREAAHAWPSADPGYLDLIFDIEDRSRKNRIIIGESRAASRNFAAACAAAERKKDPILLGTARYGEAELHFVQDPDRAEAIWQALETDSACRFDERTRITLDLALLQIRLLKAGDNDVVQDSLDQLKELGDRSLRLGLIGPLPKINLLSGFAYYRLGNYERAIAENLASYAKAELSGYGVFLWFSQNNIALMHLCSGCAAAEERALLAYASALDKAERQGFLRYLASPKPLFFQAALVDNVRRFHERFGLQRHRAALDERLRQNGADPAQLPRDGLAHRAFHTPAGFAMLFV